MTYPRQERRDILNENRRLAQEQQESDEWPCPECGLVGKHADDCEYADAEIIDLGGES